MSAGSEKVPPAGRADDWCCAIWCINSLLPEQVGPGLSSMSPDRKSSNRRDREGSTTTVTEITAAFLVRSSGYVRTGFVGIPEKALT